MELTRHLCSFCSYILYLNLKVIFSGIIIIICKYYKFCVSHCTLSTKEYFLQKKKYRKVIKTKKCQAQEKLHSILLKVKYKNPKEFWALINRERRESKPRVYLDPDIFLFSFQIFALYKKPVGGLCQQQMESCVPELDEVISFDEVCIAIKNMKSHKSLELMEFLQK